MNPKLHQSFHYIRHALQATRKGHGVHSPFAYTLCEEVFYNTHNYYDFERLGRLRKQLIKDKTIIRVKDLGAGSHTFKNNRRSIADITAKGISTKQQSETLYRLSNFLKCRNIIELGTSLGLNAMYLALSNRHARVITIEGSDSLVDFAGRLAEVNAITNIIFIHSGFDEALEDLLKELGTVDLLYIDGNHRYQATVNYFSTALPHIGNDTVFVLDDIYWSIEMTKAWEEIKKHPAVTMTIDTFYSGFVFFRKEVKEPSHLKLWL